MSGSLVHLNSNRYEKGWTPPNRVQPLEEQLRQLRMVGAVQAEKNRLQTEGINIVPDDTPEDFLAPTFSNVAQIEKMMKTEKNETRRQTIAEINEHFRRGNAV